jgi:S1-C subfamily serine protease
LYRDGDFIGTDAAKNPGNSGDALKYFPGEHVGIDTAIDVKNKGNVVIGFATTSKVTLDKLDSDNHASSAGESDYKELGPALTDINEDIAQQYGLAEDQHSVVIMDVAPGSVAERTGLEAGDVVLTLNRKPVASVDEIQGLIDDAGPGLIVPLYILRGDVHLFVIREVPVE